MLNNENMNTEDKQKAMLAGDLSAYINDKHTQEECIGFIDGYNAAFAKLKLLGMFDDVKQSEQLCQCTDSHEFVETYKKQYCQKCDGLV